MSITASMYVFYDENIFKKIHIGMKFSSVIPIIGLKITLEFSAFLLNGTMRKN